MKELRFILYAIKKNIQSSAELRTSFLMNIVGMAINNTSFIIIWVFFINSVGDIGGWNPADIIGLQGFVALCFGIVFSFGMGIRKIPEYVTTGSFDRFMLSPKNLIARVAVSSLSASAIGDIVFGVVCLCIYGFLIQAGFSQILLILIFSIMTTVIFLAIAIAIYSTSFLFADSASVTNGLFEVFMTPSLFHGGAFQGGLRFFFTFLVPSLVIGTLPVEVVKHLSWSVFFITLGLTIFWSFLSVYLFYKALKKYESSNFMTFGN